MPSVYIETTIISYLTAEPSRDLIVAAHQQITAEWWANVRAKVDCRISPFVVGEASRGDAVYAKKRLDEIAGFAMLEVNRQVEELAQTYFAALQLPEKAKIDAFHLAVAAWHQVDYVLSWNCKHIASARTQKTLQKINAHLGVDTPIVCTPEELMEI